MCLRSDEQFKLVCDAVLAALEKCCEQEKIGGQVDDLALENMDVKIVFTYSGSKKMTCNPVYDLDLCGCDRPGCVIHKVLKE